MNGVNFVGSLDYADFAVLFLESKHICRFLGALNHHLYILTMPDAVLYSGNLDVKDTPFLFSKALSSCKL